jgi:hypothetical protein
MGALINKIAEFGEQSNHYNHHHQEQEQELFVTYCGTMAKSQNNEARRYGRF